MEFAACIGILSELFVPKGVPLMLFQTLTHAFWGAKYYPMGCLFGLEREVPRVVSFPIYYTLVLSRGRHGITARKTVKLNYIVLFFLFVSMGLFLPVMRRLMLYMILAHDFTALGDAMPDGRGFITFAVGVCMWWFIVLMRPSNVFQELKTMSFDESVMLWRVVILAVLLKLYFDIVLKVKEIRC